VKPLSAPITVETLREYYASLGLTPSDAELAALVPEVQALYERADKIDAVLAREDAGPSVRVVRSPQ
jgi:hypothetical protein